MRAVILLLVSLSAMFLGVSIDAHAQAAKPNAVTPIDILLEPDATMIQHAQAVNDRLLKVFPKGFALDATHRPHITLVQRFVLTRILTKCMPPSAKSSPAPM